MYFKDVVKGDRVFSLVFGEGLVNMVLLPEQRIEGFYMMSAVFGDRTVHYTESGIPNWKAAGKNKQTVFYCNDIDMTKIDFTPNMKPLSLKKIENLIDDSELEMRCPSGLWRKVVDCPEELIRKAVKKSHAHLFRKINWDKTERRGKR